MIITFCIFLIVLMIILINCDTIEDFYQGKIRQESKKAKLLEREFQELFSGGITTPPDVGVRVVSNSPWDIIKFEPAKATKGDSYYQKLLLQLDYHRIEIPKIIWVSMDDFKGLLSSRETDRRFAIVREENRADYLAYQFRNNFIEFKIKEEEKETQQ